MSTLKQKQRQHKAPVVTQSDRERLRAEAHTQAAAAVASDPTARSDPFLYGRVHAHVMSGVGVSYAYAAPKS